MLKCLEGAERGLSVALGTPGVSQALTSSPTGIATTMARKAISASGTKADKSALHEQVSAARSALSKSLLGPGVGR